MGKRGFARREGLGGRVRLGLGKVATKAFASALLIGAIAGGCAQTMPPGSGSAASNANAHRPLGETGASGREGKCKPEGEYIALKKYASALKNKDRASAEEAWREAERLHREREGSEEDCGRADALRGMIIEERTAMDEYFLHMGNFEPEEAGEAHGRWKRAYLAIISEGE